MDVIVLGMGVGGEEVAGTLAEAGLDVLGVDNRLVGGECPYWGCIPSKMMIRAANSLAEARRVNHLAGHAEVTGDWAPVHARIRDEATDDWDDQVAVDRFTGKGGTFIRGRGRLTGPGLVEVDGTIYEAPRVVIATGTQPFIPPIPGLADRPYWTNRDAIETAELPPTLTVLGGGAIGLELAQVFARFGVEVTVVEGGERLLAAEEPESSALVRSALAADGVTFSVGRKVVRVDDSTVYLDDGATLPAETLLVATGRWSDLPGLGLDTVGLDPLARNITVDDRMRAGDDLWAVGDVTGKGAFTHIAMYQAGIAVDDILGRNPERKADYRALPRVTFTDPEIGAVGLTEHQARARGVRVQVATSPLSASTRGWIHGVGDEDFTKLVVDADRGVLIGATSAGPAGGEVLAGLAVAVHAQVPIDTLRDMIYAYPTFHRAIQATLAGL